MHTTLLIKYILFREAGICYKIICKCFVMLNKFKIINSGDKE